MSLEVDGVWKGGLWASTVWASGVWREGAPPVAGNGIVTGVFSISTPATGSAFIFNQVSGRAIINEP